MRGLLEGILSFRNEVVPKRREFFKNLVGGQAPECMLVACSDSRIAPNVFAQTAPGECFVHRCVGNLIPQYGPGNTTCTSEGAAIEYAVKVLKVKHIVICGHSECGAVLTFMKNVDGTTFKTVGTSGLPYNLSGWIEHAAPALVHFADKDYLEFVKFDETTAEHNKLAMLNVLVQMEHVYSYPDVAESVEKGMLRIHGWFFDIAAGEIKYYDVDEKKFKVIDETAEQKILADADVCYRFANRKDNGQDPVSFNLKRRRQLHRVSLDSVLFRKVMTLQTGTTKGTTTPAAMPTVTEEDQEGMTSDRDQSYLEYQRAAYHSNSDSSSSDAETPRSAPSPLPQPMLPPPETPQTAQQPAASPHQAPSSGKHSSNSSEDSASSVPGAVTLDSSSGRTGSSSSSPAEAYHNEDEIARQHDVIDKAVASLFSSSARAPAAPTSGAAASSAAGTSGVSLEPPRVAGAGVFLSKKKSSAASSTAASRFSSRAPSPPETPMLFSPAHRPRTRRARVRRGYHSSDAESTTTEDGGSNMASLSLNIQRLLQSGRAGQLKEADLNQALMQIMQSARQEGAQATAESSVSSDESVISSDEVEEQAIVVHVPQPQKEDKGPNLFGLPLPQLPAPINFLIGAIVMFLIRANDKGPNLLP